MMFSTRAEYGVRVMVALANEQEKDGVNAYPASLAQIADDNGLPFAYLEHLAARLKKAGLIESRRGPRGGYLLAQAADEISMAQIVEALEGQIAPIECISQADEGVTCTREGEVNEICPTKILWTRVQGAIVRSLTEMTLSDLTAANLRANERLEDAAARGLLVSDATVAAEEAATEEAVA
jgi:Rrf2 family protein